jgi:hypothetical protein
LDTQQKSETLRPLVRRATECIARSVAANPRFQSAQTDLGELIVDSMSSCAAPVRTMIDTCDSLYGDGAGDAFFNGPYLDILPKAVVDWIRHASR